jgi:hypothetical protein
MPHGRVREVIPAAPGAVFDLLHDYGRRLAWDTLLREARLVGGWAAAGMGAESVCRGKRRVGGIALRTAYVQFKRGEVAAVKLVNRPPFFDTFAASIRHGPAGEGASWVEYTYTFTARPRWLRFVLHPVMGLAFRVETRKRLRALRGWFERNGGGGAGR